jgi:hypothetical protein
MCDFLKDCRDCFVGQRNPLYAPNDWNGSEFRGKNQQISLNDAIFLGNSPANRRGPTRGC